MRASTCLDRRILDESGSAEGGRSGTQRSIDYPIEDLPAIDEHSVEIERPIETVWPALLTTLPRALGGRLPGRFSQLLGCEHSVARGHPARVGSTLAGFVVARSVEPVLLALEGQHRFSRYALIFRLDRLPDERARLRAETRAEFPGVKGFAYRALVIGSRVHVLVTRRMLAAVRRRAEHGVRNSG